MGPSTSKTHSTGIFLRPITLRLGYVCLFTGFYGRAQIKGSSSIGFSQLHTLSLEGHGDISVISIEKISFRYRYGGR